MRDVGDQQESGAEAPVQRRAIVKIRKGIIAVSAIGRRRSRPVGPLAPRAPCAIASHGLNIGHELPPI